MSVVRLGKCHPVEHTSVTGLRFTDVCLSSIYIFVCLYRCVCVYIYSYVYICYIFISYIYILISIIYKLDKFTAMLIHALVTYIKIYIQVIYMQLYVHVYICACVHIHTHVYI